jgi:prepilin-type N-terminal cleavage/methylation domain-containing protein
MTIDTHGIEPRATAADSGFSLIEVVVAIALLIIVSTSALYFVSKARYTSTDQQATQIAATLASSTMEQVYAVPTKISSASGVSNLYTGRYRTDVTAAFAANSSITGVSSTFPVWDSTATTTSATAACPTPTVASIPTSGPLIPVSCTNTVNGTTYTVTTLIGACYRAASYANAAAQDCTAPSTVTAPSASAPVPAASTTSRIQLTRVIVIVAWNASTSCPLAGGCTYSTAALFSTDTDPTWASN